MSVLQFSFLGWAMRLARPEYLAGLAAALLLMLLGVAASRRRQRLLAKTFEGATLNRAVPLLVPGRMAAKNLLGALGVACFSLALAQPQCGTHSELAKRYGIDLVIAVDASSSMLARDVKPSRIERAKLELSGLIDRLKGDRVAIVVFAGDAFTQCPLTTDYAAAKMFLRAIDPASLPVQGTDIARALEESKNLLVEAERGAKARAIVLLTDGEDTAGSAVDKQAQELSSLGIKVLSVGIGSAIGEPIPVVDSKGNPLGYKKDREGNTVMSRLDETGLQALAEKTGGRYVRPMPGGVSIQEVHEELDRLDKSEFESRLTVRYEERFQLLALPGMLLLLIGAALRPGRRGAGA